MQSKYTAIGRRSFVRDGMLLLGAVTAGSTRLLGDAQAEHLQFAILTDSHYADKPSAGTRHYRQTLGKLQEAAAQFARDTVLGDSLIYGLFGKRCPTPKSRNGPSGAWHF